MVEPVIPSDLPAPPSELAAVAVAVGARAAELLASAAHLDRVRVHTKSTGTDMVTEMDHRSEALLVEAIADARPDDAVMGEEGSRVTGTSGVEWILDPLDGTTNYLYGYPGWCVSVAATVGGRSVAGAVIDPMHDETFVAALGEGATCNGNPLELGPPPPLEEALVSSGFAYEPGRRGRQARALAEVLPHVRDLRRGGAAAVDLCWVGLGRIDAFYERGLQVWDLAAGTLVASEAGAKVRTAATGEPARTFTVVAHPDLFDDLERLLSDAGADLA